MRKCENEKMRKCENEKMEKVLKGLQRCVIGESRRESESIEDRVMV